MIYLLSRVTELGGGTLYLLIKRKIKHIIPAGIFLGQISSSYRERFESLGSTRVLMYYSQRKGILGEKMVSRVSTYDVAAKEALAAHH